MATIAAVAVIFVGGIVALAWALAFIRPHADQRPEVGTQVVAPDNPPPPSAAPPPPPAAPVPAAPPPQAPVSPAPSPHSGDHEHWDDWLHRHLGPGVPVP